VTGVDAIEAFLAGSPHAVVGASRDRAKYGNRCLRAYVRAGRRVFAVNPEATEVEGQIAYPTLAALPERPHGISIVTPPDVTQRVAADAIALGIRHVWIQPGAESPEALDRLRTAGIDAIAGGPCILVALRWHE
jgi:predicted CoA-binding protein